MSKPENNPRLVPVILAGGSGTRFWPRSRRTRAKQVLALDGEQTMIQQTVERLTQLAAAEDIWVITNDGLAATIEKQLPQLRVEKILREPAARNTAPAAALAAMLLERNDPDAVIGIFPADHVVGDQKKFTAALQQGARVAAAGDNIVVLGVTPTHAETGYGYIELSGEAMVAGIATKSVRRFTEKPDAKRAAEFVAAKNYLWNSGVFLCTAKTLANATRLHCAKWAKAVETIAAAWGTEKFAETFAAQYPVCDNISLDYAVIEPRSARAETGIYCLPAEFGWNDLGSWAALYAHKLAQRPGAENITEAAETLAMEAHGNYVYAPGKMVALLGVEDLVIVETDDALLITTRAKSQDVGRIVKALSEKKHDEMI